MEEADEILISDYGSTDGTLDVLEDFSVKYPKIIYAIHKDVPTSDRYDWLFQNAQGKYVRFIGGHDMVSSGSSKSMVALLESNPDAVMVYSKYCIELNSDYTFYNFLHMNESWINELSADSPFDRVRGATCNINWHIYYAMYKKDIFELAMEQSIFTQPRTDMAVVLFLASKGKLLADDSSTFFWMNPRPRLDFARELKRTALSNSLGKTDHPFYWPFLIICEQYDIARDMQTWESAPDNFSEELLNLSIQGRQFLFSEEYEINSFVLPSFQIRPGKEQLCKKVLNTVLDLQQEKKQKQELEWKKNARLSKKIKKIIKFLLPYGIIRCIQKKQS
jgi:glycosyltransferase involved in cell wall biosynthesis